MSRIEQLRAMEQAVRTETIEAVRRELTDEETAVIRRAATWMQRLYGHVYEANPSAHGTDMGYGDVK